MLHFINPAILAPDSYHIVDQDSLTLQNRRNLILLCKLIQNISNQHLCNEEWMIECNPFIQAHLDRLEEFYQHVLMDPQQSAGEQPFQDILQAQSLHAMESPSIDRSKLSLEGLVAMDRFLRDHKVELMEIFSQLDHSECSLSQVGAGKLLTRLGGRTTNK